MVTMQTERVVAADGLVRLKITLPTPMEDKWAKSFNAYISALREGFTAYGNTTLAKEAARLNTTLGGALNTVLCFENDRVLSMYVDAVVTDSGGSRFHRMATLWHKGGGTLIAPKALFVGGKRDILPPLLSSFREKVSHGATVYSDGEAILKRRFDIKRCYISPGGLVFYYPGGVLGHGVEPFALPLCRKEIEPFIKQDMAKLIWD